MNKIYFILILLLMTAVVWKSNHDRLKREQESEQQLQQHMKKMAQMQLEYQRRLERQEAEKAKKVQQRMKDNQKARLESERLEHEMRMKEYSKSEYPNSYEEEEMHRYISE